VQQFHQTLSASLQQFGWNSIFSTRLVVLQVFQSFLHFFQGWQWQVIFVRWQGARWGRFLCLSLIVQQLI
jgi:lysozyme family protein